MASGDNFAARQTDIGTVNAKGEAHTNLTNDFDRDVQALDWSADGKTIYFTASSEGDVPLYSIPAKGGAAATLIGGDLGVMDFDVKTDGIVYAHTAISAPWDVSVFGLKDKKSTLLTSLNPWASKKRIIFPKEYWVTRPDGVKVQYWVMEPAGRKDGSKYPTILNIHGGPTAMWGPSAFSMWHEFQLESSWGYGVVYCNPRGSGGYGDAFKK